MTGKYRAGAVPAAGSEGTQLAAAAGEAAAEAQAAIARIAPSFTEVVVARIVEREKHPDADKLSVCTVDVGPAGGVKTIVCGAHNCDAGQRVLVAAT